MARERGEVGRARRGEGEGDRGRGRGKGERNREIKWSPSALTHPCAVGYSLFSFPLGVSSCRSVAEYCLCPLQWIFLFFLLNMRPSPPSENTHQLLWRRAQLEAWLFSTRRITARDTSRASGIHWLARHHSLGYMVNWLIQRGLVPILWMAGWSLDWEMSIPTSHPLSHSIGQSKSQARLELELKGLWVSGMEG